MPRMQQQLFMGRREEWKKQAATRINERRKAQKAEEIYCRSMSSTA